MSQQASTANCWSAGSSLFWGLNFPNWVYGIFGSSLFSGSHCFWEFLVLGSTLLGVSHGLQM